jgi:UV DNA damage endonuclease
MRLGFVVRPLARPELKSHDSRRWQNGPHLSVSLAYLRDVLEYLNAAGIRMYRMSSSLAPYATHPDLPGFTNQLEDCADELAQVGRIARDSEIRLSIHVAQYVIMNALDPAIQARGLAETALQAAILDAMHLGPEAVVVVHLGGAYSDHAAALERFAAAFLRLPESTRRRLVLENDDTRFGVSDILEVHQMTGIRLVFDSLHHRLCNPEAIPVREALAACLATWPADQTPKIHFSTPRTEWLADTEGHSDAPHLRKSRWGRHSDFVNPFEFIDFMRAADGLRSFDVMLEVRGRDLALSQLRADLAVFAPDLTGRLEPPLIDEVIS